MPSVYVHSVTFSSLSRSLFEARGPGSHVFLLRGGQRRTTRVPSSLNRLITFWVQQRPQGPRRTNIALKIVG